MQCFRMKKIGERRDFGKYCSVRCIDLPLYIEKCWHSGELNRKGEKLAVAKGHTERKR